MVADSGHSIVRKNIPLKLKGSKAGRKPKKPSSPRGRRTAPKKEAESEPQHHYHGTVYGNVTSHSCYHANFLDQGADPFVNSKTPTVMDNANYGYHPR